MHVPGMIVANPPGIKKRNVTYSEIVSQIPAVSRPRLTWVSRFGSITWNVFGREFPDGGMNEAGLCVAEMTLLGTVWPKGSRVPRMYHHQWIQFLLDNCATVQEVIASFASALPAGHCRWHFLLVDESGHTAVIEFLGGKPVVYMGDELPYRVLCNAAYTEELKNLGEYDGFGGSKAPAPRHQGDDPRFRWAALALHGYDGSLPAVDFTLNLLDRLNLGTRKWAIACDIPKRRLCFHTSIAPSLRWIEAAGDFLSISNPSQALDIHLQASGDVGRHLTHLSPQRNHAAVAAAWAEIDLGLFGNLVFRPLVVQGISRAAASLGR
jgi:choloylglycine hydrolase